MRDKAYVVINNEQEQYILSKFGKMGIKWTSGMLATEFKTKKDKDGYLTVISYKKGNGIGYFYLVDEHMLDDMDVEFDGRKEDIMAEKPKKWVVRYKETDYEEISWYILVVDMFNFSHTINVIGTEKATKFDTKEEAESWANAHQEVVEVEE